MLGIAKISVSDYYYILSLVNFLNVDAVLAYTFGAHLSQIVRLYHNF